ncbi:MAG: hypothetical protein EP330_27860 [Deltaproteobacteria bacterium]|nr:MAG: hypothetical protein EP330_27860 [Deltaproteobacteria bacterium]
MRERSPGIGPAAFVGLLFGMFTLGMLGIAWSVYGVLTPDPTASEVSRILGTPRWSVFHDHSEAGDASAGCAITADEVVRWDDGAITGSVPLRGSVGHYAANRGVTVRTPDDEVLFCPFAAGEGGEDFAEWVIADGRAINDGAEAPRDPRLE